MIMQHTYQYLDADMADKRFTTILY